MPRIARAIAPGYPHHVTQRGNYRQPVFETEDDYRQYITWLKDYSSKYDLHIWAYCLMSNHVHFICVPQNQDSLAKTFNALHMRYSQYVNQKKGARGHLWQGRFYSCILDERHLHAAIRYVENNPVRAGMVKNPEHYKWSSARGHIGEVIDTVLADDCFLNKEIKNWREYLEQKEDSRFVVDIRKSSMSGRPCGNKNFVGQIEAILNRKLHALPRGRPRKKV